MQRVPSDLNVFIQQRLSRFASNESAVVELCCTYLRQNQFESNADLAQAAATLFMKLDSWGHYPTKLVACCLSWKLKGCFDEMKDNTQTEAILKILSRVLGELPHPNIARLYLGLILAQKVQNLGDKEAVKSVIQCCVKNLRRHQELDRLINLILIKFTLKVSEHIRELKSEIATGAIEFVLGVAGRCYLSQLEPLATMKPLMDYLKLLVALGREIASRNTDEVNSNQDPHSHLIGMLVKVLILNLTLTPSAGEYPISYTMYNEVRPDHLQEVFQNPLMEEISSSTESRSYSGIDAVSYLQPAFPSLEQEVELTHATEEPQTTELIEKIKVNSIKLLMVIARNYAQIFDRPDIHEMIFPSALKSMDCKQVFSNPGFMPIKLFNTSFTESLDFLYSDSIVVLSGLKSRYQTQGKAAVQFLQETRTNLKRSLFGTDEAGQCQTVSFICAFLNEGKNEIKAMLMECLGVIHQNLYRLSLSQETSAAEPAKNSAKVQYSLTSLREWGVAILLIYFVELYTCKSPQFKFILEGIATCPSESILMHVPNKMVDRILEYFVIPVLATCVHSPHDFLAQFDKFLETIFEAGFSEYFLSKINSTKLILETLVTYCSLQRDQFSQADAATAVKVILFCVNGLLDKYPAEFVDLLPLLTGFLETCVLQNYNFASLHHFGPEILEKVSMLERNYPAERTSTRCLGLHSRDDSECWLLSRHKRTDLVRFLEGNALAVHRPLPNSYTSVLLVRDDLLRLFTQVIAHAMNTQLRDKMERTLVSALLSIDPTELRFIEPVLLRKSNVDTSQFLDKLMQDLKNQKNKLLVVEHILSCKLELMSGLRKKMWANLFAMYKDKVLSVEIVFTNYNIIYGLRHFPELIADEHLKDIILHTISSLRSKNRKLLNNCLKIFGYILGFYSFNILKWIVDADVPNVFNEDMQGEGQPNHQTIPGSIFLGMLFRKFNSHKYSKYNIVAVSSATHILKRLEQSDHPVSRKLLDVLVRELSSILIEKIATTESYKYHSLTSNFLGRDAVLRFLPPLELQVLATIGLAKISKAESVEVNSLSSEHFYWKELQAKAFTFFLQIHSFMLQQTDPESKQVREETYGWLLTKSHCLPSWIRELTKTHNLESAIVESTESEARRELSRSSGTDASDFKIKITPKQRSLLRHQVTEFLDCFLQHTKEYSDSVQKSLAATDGVSRPSAHRQVLLFPSSELNHQNICSLLSELRSLRHTFDFDDEHSFVLKTVTNSH